MNLNTIEESIVNFLNSIPSAVTLVAAAKTRTSLEVQAAIHAGIKVIGYNYLQEAELMHKFFGNVVQWHMIGHLQRNKAKRAVKLFDMIETLDSLQLAVAINKQCENEGTVMPVLVEINSGREPNKTGVLPENVEDLIRELRNLHHLKIQGLMTMGPRFGNPEDARPYFKATRKAFDRLKKMDIPNIEMRYLSMEMSNIYKIAIEEGANIVRIGTKLFGGRYRKI